MKALASAFGFFTAIPVPKRWLDGGETMGRTAALLPVVGAAVGGCTWLTALVAGRFLPAPLAAALTAAAAFAVTGGLHWDGWTDTCDALWSRRPRERRLAILRDPSTGALGAGGLALWLLVYWAAAAAIIEAGAAHWLLVAALWGRAVITAVLGWGRPVRSEGLGALFFRHTPRWCTLTALAAAAGAAWWLGGADAVLRCAAAAATGAAFAWGCGRVFGGHTGDTLGAVNQWTEAAVLTAAVWRMP